MNSPEPQPQPQPQPQSDPFELLSPELKTTWAYVLQKHPWIIREEEEDKSKLSNSND